MDNLPVLFLPGTLCTAAVFNLQIQALKWLAPRIDVVEFTFEDSVSKLADKAVERMSGQGAMAVIGFSMGGMVALEIYRKAPELVGKLALLNSNCHADRTHWQSARALHLRQARTEGIEYVIRQHYLNRYLYHSATSDRELIVSMANELGVACFEAQIKALASRPDSSASLPGIECPTLILGARQDEMCPPATQAQMTRLIAGSELVMLDQCGHFSMLEKPLEVNRALTSWYPQG